MYSATFAKKNFTLCAYESPEVKVGERGKSYKT